MPKRASASVGIVLRPLFLGSGLKSQELPTVLAALAFGRNVDDL